MLGGKNVRIIPFQLRLLEDISRKIKMDAASKSMTKHEWIQKAVAEKLERDQVV